MIRHDLDMQFFGTILHLSTVIFPADATRVPHISVASLEVVRDKFSRVAKNSPAIKIIFPYETIQPTSVLS